MEEIKIGGCFKITKKIGGGSFGEIYHGINEKSGFQVAVKVEKINTQSPQLLYECNLYQQLHEKPKQQEEEDDDDSSSNDDSDSNDCSNSSKSKQEQRQENEQFIGIPEVYYCSQEGEYNIMMMELLGVNLMDLMKFCGGKFGLQTGIKVFLQMLDRVEYMHQKEFLHRDLKPENFLIGRGENVDKIYMVDLGLAKKYKLQNKKHKPFRENVKGGITGTARYVSINTHYGREQSRRDDLESLGYVLLFLVKGELPWQNQKEKNKFEKIKDIKIETDLEVLCDGFPQQFQEYIKYVRNLQFQSIPDYQYIRELFLGVLENEQQQQQQNFDWWEKVELIKKQQDKLVDENDQEIYQYLVQQQQQKKQQ